MIRPPKGQPKILTIDLETSPGLADIWKLWDNNVSLSQLREVSRVISFAAKWYGKKSVEFRSEFHDGKQEMLERAAALLDEADIIITYNGKSFDEKHLNREFLLAGIPMPAPYEHVDLLLEIRKKFKFMSNKLDHIAEQLGYGNKVKHAGHELWVQCLLGDPKAWAAMRRYNKHDVVLTEQVYTRVKAWIRHPHMGLLTGRPDDCPRCSSTDYQQRGYRPLGGSLYPRFRCNACGHWFRHFRRVAATTTRSI